MKKSFGDIDIDIRDREEILELINHIPASIIKDDTIEKHNTGVYIQNIPKDPITGLASIDYDRAEELGYIKIDLLNLNAYKDIKSNEKIQELIDKEPTWDLLQHEEIVAKLYHIHDHFDIVNKMKPESVEQLAMVLALIRPGKRYLLGRNWTEIEKEIWVKKEGDKYSFKKAHGLAYALLIVMQMNQMIEEVSGV